MLFLSLCPVSNVILPFHFSHCPTLISVTSLSSLSSITSDQGATECPENDEDERYIWLPARDGLLEELLCQSVEHISQQLQKPEVKPIKIIMQISKFFEAIQVQKVCKATNSVNLV